MLYFRHGRNKLQTLKPVRKAITKSSCVKPRLHLTDINNRSWKQWKDEIIANDPLSCVVGENWATGTVWLMRPHSNRAMAWAMCGKEGMMSFNSRAVHEEMAIVLVWLGWGDVCGDVGERRGVGGVWVCEAMVMTMAVECRGEMVVFGKREAVKGSMRKTDTLCRRGTI
jgi:hypothetical protein